MRYQWKVFVESESGEWYPSSEPFDSLGDAERYVRRVSFPNAPRVRIFYRKITAWEVW